MNTRFRRSAFFFILTIALFYLANWYLSVSDQHNWFSFPNFMLMIFACVGCFINAIYNLIEGMK